jgi:hypothetical protein
MIERAQALAEALIAAGADAPFLHDGLIHFLTPRWVVEAYAVARLEKCDPYPAVLSAAFGKGALEELSVAPKCLALQLGRSWVARCGDLERKMRGLPGEATRVAA